MLPNLIRRHENEKAKCLWSLERFIDIPSISRCSLCWDCVWCPPFKNLAQALKKVMENALKGIKAKSFTWFVMSRNTFKAKLYLICFEWAIINHREKRKVSTLQFPNTRIRPPPFLCPPPLGCRRSSFSWIIKYFMLSFELAETRKIWVLPLKY